jgi:hypothetical protein
MAHNDTGSSDEVRERHAGPSHQASTSDALRSLDLYQEHSEVNSPFVVKMFDNMKERAMLVNEGMEGSHDMRKVLLEIHTLGREPHTPQELEAMSRAYKKKDVAPQHRENEEVLPKSNEDVGGSPLVRTPRRTPRRR